jgi:outer membrane immunogenic protein
MKKLLLASTVFVSFAVAGSVHAADVGEINHDWSGAYVGLTAGAATLYFDHQIDVLDNDYAGDGVLSDGTYSREGLGFIGGATIGLNLQHDSIVFGLEADYSFVNASAKTGDFYNYNGPSSPRDVGNVTTELASLGTLRGRVGFAVDDLLVYGTGGLAMGDVSVDQFDEYDDNNSPGEESSVRYGWTVGAGVEYAATENISVKAEALYYDLGSESLGYGDGVADADYGEYENEVSGIVARAGVNFNF